MATCQGTAQQKNGARLRRAPERHPPAARSVPNIAKPLVDECRRPATGHTPSQLALAWLLKRSPVMLPIPGTSSTGHVEDNIAAAELSLSADEVAALEAAVG